jgi:hypothetical protein
VGWNVQLYLAQATVMPQTGGPGPGRVCHEVPISI